MDEIFTLRLRSIEAEPLLQYRGPLRMHGWRRVEPSAGGVALRKALWQRALWKRSVVAGLVAGVLAGVGGVEQGLATGGVVLACCAWVQCWQFAVSKREGARWRRN